MIQDVEKSKTSIDSIINNVFIKLSVIVCAVISVLFVSLFAYFLHSSHVGLCELALEKSRFYVNPLSRELILGNSALAGEIFGELNTNLKNLAGKSSLNISYFNKNTTGGMDGLAKNEA